jgi:hypothetical protein
VNDAEREGQRREGALRAAITPPIATAAFEARSGMVSGEDAERPATCTESGQLPAAIVPAATLPVAQGCHCWPVADAKLGGAAGLAGCPWAPRAPVSPYEVKAQTVILAVLLTGANSDISRQLITQVRHSVVDAERGHSLLFRRASGCSVATDH